MEMMGGGRWMEIAGGGRGVLGAGEEGIAGARLGSLPVNP